VFKSWSKFGITNLAHQILLGIWDNKLSASNFAASLSEVWSIKYYKPSTIKELFLLCGRSLSPPSLLYTLTLSPSLSHTHTSLSWIRYVKNKLQYLLSGRWHIAFLVFVLNIVKEKDNYRSWIVTTQERKYTVKNILSFDMWFDSWPCLYINFEKPHMRAASLVLWLTYRKTNTRCSIPGGVMLYILKYCSVTFSEHFEKNTNHRLR